MVTGTNVWWNVVHGGWRRNLSIREERIRTYGYGFFLTGAAFKNGIELPAKNAIYCSYQLWLHSWIVKSAVQFEATKTDTTSTLVAGITP